MNFSPGRPTTEDDLEEVRRYEADPARIAGPADRARLRFISLRTGPVARRASELLRLAQEGTR